MSLPRTATGFVSDVRSGRFAMPTTWEKIKALLARELNFYRIHLLAFVFVSRLKVLCLMIDPTILLGSHVWDQHRISYPLYRLPIPLCDQYDSQWTRHGGPIDFEHHAAGHYVLADAHRVSGRSLCSRRALGSSADPEANGRFSCRL